jgi:hypothetical protein
MGCISTGLTEADFQCWEHSGFPTQHHLEKIEEHHLFNDHSRIKLRMQEFDCHWEMGMNISINQPSWKVS